MEIRGFSRKKKLSQWFLKISKYSDELLEDSASKNGQIK